MVKNSESIFLFTVKILYFKYILANLGLEVKLFLNMNSRKTCGVQRLILNLIN